MKVRRGETGLFPRFVHDDGDDARRSEGEDKVFSGSKGDLVDEKGIEPSTSALRTPRSPS